MEKEGNAVYFWIILKIIGRYDLQTKLEDGQLETPMQWPVVVMKSRLVFSQCVHRSGKVFPDMG